MAHEPRPADDAADEANLLAAHAGSGVPPAAAYPDLRPLGDVVADLERRVRHLEMVLLFEREQRLRVTLDRETPVCVDDYGNVVWVERGGRTP